MCAVAVIPARYASVRFPGKVLADRTGKPLIQHVYERALLAKRIDRIVIATDDDRIADAVRSFGGECVVTGDHPNGTSRIAEVATSLDVPIIVNVQGDEPEIDPALIDLAIDTLEEQPECPVATVAAPFGADESPTDPNVVKVVVNQNGRALYFSRAHIPHVRDAGSAQGTSLALKHIGLYVYRREFLSTYLSLAPSPLEQAEQLEQLRILEHGHQIAVAVTDHPVPHQGIDTPAQYEAFVARWHASQFAAP